MEKKTVKIKLPLTRSEKEDGWQRVAELPGCCRGGYQPPAQGNPTTTNDVGRIRTMSDLVPFTETRKNNNLAGICSLPYRGSCVFWGVIKYFARLL